MTDDEFKYVFGPVASRRLGRSLGVDLVPYKVCTFDCVYCQLGRTTVKTLERKEYVPMKEVLSEVARKLEGGAAPDYITLAGSGEPTLYARVGELIAAVKQMTDVPVAVLTNGSLMGQPSVRRALLAADMVSPSLDAGSAEAFQRINRPHPNLEFDAVVDGLAAFREEFSNQLWLEVFLVAGIVDLDDEVPKIARHIKRIRPDRVQLNTVARPPAESWARPVSAEDMQRYAQMLGEHVDIIADIELGPELLNAAATEDDVLNALKRRPCSIEDLVKGLAVPRTEVARLVDGLAQRGLIVEEPRSGHVFYKAVVG